MVGIQKSWGYRNYIVPHENFIKALIFGGMPIIKEKEYIPTIDELMTNYLYNSLPKEYYEEIETRCYELEEKYDERIIDYNRKIYDIYCLHSLSSNNIDEELKTPQKLIKEFMYPEMFIVIMNNLVFNSKGIEKANNLSSHLEILDAPAQRQYIENAILMKLGVEEIIYGWNMLFPYNELKTTKKSIAKFKEFINIFKYYLWNVSRVGRSTLSMNKTMLANYYELEAENSYYNIHRRLLYGDILSFKSYFGFITDDDRSMVIKQMYGKLSAEILRRIKDNRVIPMDLITLFEHTDNRLKEDFKERDESNLDKYRNIVSDMISRIKFSKGVRKTLDEIKEREINKDEYEKIYVEDSPLEE